MAKFCPNESCYNPYNHTNDYHRCYKCGQFRHPTSECLNLDDNHDFILSKSLPDELWCKSSLCNSPHTHMSNGHVCSKCGSYHIDEECKLGRRQQFIADTPKDAVLYALTKFGKRDGKIYICVNGIDDNVFIIKRDSNISQIRVYQSMSDTFISNLSKSDVHSFYNGYTRM